MALPEALSLHKKTKKPHEGKRLLHRRFPKAAAFALERKRSSFQNLYRFPIYTTKAFDYYCRCI